jgi:hypothetical protein
MDIHIQSNPVKRSPLPRLGLTLVENDNTLTHQFKTSHAHIDRHILSKLNYSGWRAAIQRVRGAHSTPLTTEQGDYRQQIKISRARE